ncbi:hypothetical protein Tco_0874263 [Tanacetum coccineum]|uniref:Retrovirus-related Pol polyprotein from transposon TNT 1-94-like beta-barrel domain-containing protein n=1 Tax=Tanacetum coccineum TaxID=301880 RepID=A0ABQ5BNY0_9ASTR
MLLKVEKHNKAKTRIQSRGYEIALESLESRILGHEKNELAWGEKYEFQNYELKCREIKVNNLNLELEKVVKERDELKLKIEKWEESSKNLDELLNSQMSISLSVFDVRSSDEESTPANDRSSKADGYHAVPPPITGNFLTPRADISFASLDEYVIRKKIIELKTTDLNTKISETVGKTNEANIQKPKTIYESVNKDKVIIEDWNSDDEDDVSEVQTVLGNPKILLQDHAVVDSGCSSHMTGNKAYLSDYEDFNGGFVAFGSSSGKDKGPTQEYIKLPLQPHRTRILVKDVAPAAHEKPSESSPKDNDVQNSKDDVDKKEQHQMKESEQDLQDELEKMVTQELAAKAMDDVSRQAFEEG